MIWSEVPEREILIGGVDRLLIVPDGNPQTPSKILVNSITDPIVSNINSIGGDLIDHGDDLRYHPIDVIVSYLRSHYWVGTVTWDYNTGLLSWSSPIYLFLPLASYRVTYPTTLSPLTLPSTRSYVLSDLSNTTPNLTVETVADTWPGDTLSSFLDRVVMAYRAGNTLLHDIRSL